MTSIEQTQEVASNFTWKELETRFRDVQARTTSSQDVFASWTRTERNTGFIEEEWELRGPAYWWSEFVELASIAAQKLGYAPDENAVKYWLGQVGKWMQKRGLEKDKNVGWCPDGSGSDGIRYMYTQKIAGLSADFCLHLSPRESAVSPPLTENDSQRITLAHSAAPIHPKGTPKALTPTEKKKRSAIFAAISTKDEGLKYCKTLDERKLAVPADWIQDGCPKNYADAYKAGGPWRKRIQDEKSRYKEKYDQTPAAEREKPLQ
jgi:hypothetical protein